MTGHHAGRELDALIWETVLLRGPPPGPPVDDDEEHGTGCCVGYEPDDCDCGLQDRLHFWEDELPAYSTDLRAAWEVVDAFARIDCEPWLAAEPYSRVHEPWRWTCRLRVWPLSSVRAVVRHAATPALAVCRAALVAMDLHCKLDGGPP